VLIKSLENLLQATTQLTIWNISL